MHSDCKHLAIEHQVVLCCQPIQLMNSCLTEHALWKDSEAPGILHSLSIHHHQVGSVGSLEHS